MLSHYLKIAWRNLTKYKVQNLIALLALAIGFTGFSLCLYWIKYEMSYDSFHKDAEHIFMVRKKAASHDGYLSHITPPILASYLKETYPEIEEACNTSSGYMISPLIYKDQEYTSYNIRPDRNFINLFNIQLLSGSFSFIMPGGKEIAITDEFAKEIFGEQEPLGEMVEVMKNEYTIGAVIKGFGSHTNLKFNIYIAEAENTEYSWYMSSQHTYIKLKKGTNTKQLADKLNNVVINDEEGTRNESFKITPITAIRYNDPIRSVKVKFDHLLLFTVASGLVLFCAILNYLILFVCRLQIRSKEFALRKTCGASYTSLRKLFIFEFGIILIFSIFLGLLLSEIVLPLFKELTNIKINNTSVYLETLMFSLIISLFTILFSAVYIHYLNKHTIYSVFKSGYHFNKYVHNQKLLITIQLIIGILFIFCTSVAISQIHLLTHSEQIIERKGRAVLNNYSEPESFLAIMQANPYITEVLLSQYTTLFPQTGTSHYYVTKWDDKPSNKSPFAIEWLRGDERYCNYYGMELVKGSFLKDKEYDYVLINETAWHQFGWKEPIGKQFEVGSGQKKIVCGVIRDFCKTVPTIPVKPLLIFNDKHSFPNGALFKFQEGSWKQCKTMLEEEIQKNYPEVDFWLYNAEEEYNKMLESENALVILLDFTSIICIFISMFGVYSIISLDCVNRKKEMAIRKINGAGTGTIICYFLKRYLILLIIGSIIAFPVGYYIMRSWVQNYILQTPIPYWYYIGILSFFIIMVCLSISSSLIKIIRVNPIKCLKTEG